MPLKAGEHRPERVSQTALFLPDEFAVPLETGLACKESGLEVAFQ